MHRHLRILHVSDLHERAIVDGMPAERSAVVRATARSRHRVLGDAFEAVLMDDVLVGGKPDVICFTGDVADWGMPAEYVKVGERIDRLLALTGVTRERLFVVPGNHDVQRRTEDGAWTSLRALSRDPSTHSEIGAWMAGQRAPRGAAGGSRDAVLKRTQSFWDWVARERGDDALNPGRSQHGRLGYRFTLTHLGIPVHLVGLDSAWLAGDDNDAGRLLLTREQIHMLAFDAEGRPLPGFRLALVHHPLSWLADARDSRIALSEGVDLLLHGHVHEVTAEDQVDPDRTLRVLGAGSLYEGDAGDRWVNRFHRIDVSIDGDGRPTEYEVTFYGWSSNGHWHRSEAEYKAARGGVLRWGGAATNSPSHEPTRATTRPRSLIALGPDVVAEGERVAASGSMWTVRLDRFIMGSVSDLTRLADRDTEYSAGDRCVVLGETSEARPLVGDLNWSTEAGIMVLRLPVGPASPRQSVAGLKDMDPRSLKTVRDAAAGATRLQCWLGTPVGMLEKGVGTWMPRWLKVGELATRVDDLARMEVARLSFVSRRDDVSGDTYTPLDIVGEVLSLQTRPEDGDAELLPMDVEVRFVGGGPWKGTIDIARQPADLESRAKTIDDLTKAWTRSPWSE